MLNKKHIAIFTFIFTFLSSAIFCKITGKAITDTTPPVFKSISLDKINAVGGDNIMATIDATDDVSGLKSAYIQYKSPAGQVAKQATLYPDSDGVLKGSISIGIYDKEGTWKLDMIQLRDMAGNAVNISCSTTDLSTGDYNVSKVIPDTKAPVFKSISIDKSNVIAGDNIVVTIDATDDVSGLQYAYIQYKSPAGQVAKQATLYPDSDGVLKGSISIGIYDIEGTWKVDMIQLRDMAGNAINISNSTTDLSAGEFNVQDESLLKKDVNKDGVIDIKDIALIASNYNYNNSNINWNADLDINNDGIIDIYDIVLVSKQL